MILSWDSCGWEIIDRIHLRNVAGQADMAEFTHGTAVAVARATRL